ncbi:MAG: DUF4870 domain-containing protein [Verrucomicrobiota bacterium]
MTYDSASTPPSLPAAPATGDKALLLLCHLSVFVGAPFLLPFIVWLVKRHDPDTAGAHAAEVLNFHLSFLLWTLLCLPLIWIGVGFVLLFALWLAGLILAIVGAVKASDGILYRYPLTLRLVG